MPSHQMPSTLIRWSKVRQAGYYGMEPGSALGLLGLWGQSLKGEARMGCSWGLPERAWATLLLMSADGPPRENGGGRRGGERPRQPLALWGEGEMVTEASGESGREKSRQGEEPGPQPQEVGSGGREGLGMSHSPE